jgi:hypothetical protein
MSLLPIFYGLVADNAVHCGAPFLLSLYMTTRRMSRIIL